MVARADGVIVSSNVAPASATHSVMKNKLLAAAYAGTDYFPPIEIFPPDTSNAVMTLMLIHDLNNTNSCAHPGTKVGWAPARYPCEDTCQTELSWCTWDAR
eukprot:m.132428 g.132428  ORF g.132428 m.132428 type:complete len:101 (-) comp17499_c0_seq2:181-483(-)